MAIRTTLDNWNTVGTSYPHAVILTGKYYGKRIGAVFPNGETQVVSMASFPGAKQNAVTGAWHKREVLPGDTVVKFTKRPGKRF